MGVISPKIRITRVSRPVAIPTAVLPNKRIINVVVSEEATILTRLLPIRIVERSFVLLSSNLRIRAARFEP